MPPEKEKDSIGIAHTQKVKLPPNTQTIWASPHGRASQPLNRDTEALSNCEKLQSTVHSDFFAN